MNGVAGEIKNAFKGTNNAHVQLILINLIVFVGLLFIRVPFELFGNKAVYSAVLEQLAMPSNVEEFIYKPWTILTYGFVHEGFFHILGNLITLYWFGSLITEFLGSRRVINLYILGAVFGGILYILAYNFLPLLAPFYKITILVGASAAVYAIMVAAATLLPDYTFYLMFLGPVRIKYIALFLIILSTAETIGLNPGGNFAHLGGALIGYIYVKQLKMGNDLGKPISATLDFLKNIGKPKSKVRVSYRNDKNISSNYAKKNSPDQVEIDRILDKISVSGYNSLSKEEKEELFSASQKK